MKALIAAVFVLALAGCEPSGQSRPNEVSPHQQPSVTTPGITVSGSAEFGLKRGF